MRGSKIIRLFWISQSGLNQFYVFSASRESKNILAVSSTLAFLSVISSLIDLLGKFYRY